MKPPPARCVRGNAPAAELGAEPTLILGEHDEAAGIVTPSDLLAWHRVLGKRGGRQCAARG